MKIGIAQINTTVGNIDGNTALIVEAYESLLAQAADLVLFPELTISGYPPLDFLQKKRFIDECYRAAESLSKKTSKPLIVGCPIFFGVSKKPRNAALWCENGEIRKTFLKQLLPTYDVFDEKRYFEPGNTSETIEYNGYKFSVTICEDIWVADEQHETDSTNPVRSLHEKNPDLMLNLSASPWHLGKSNLRDRHLTHTAKTLKCPVVYCNAIGGNDELIFDGRSLVYDSEGRKVLSISPFAESTAIYDLDIDYPEIVLNELNEISDCYDALVIGLRDYTKKTGFKKAHIGLSGGIDSAVTACLAAEALGVDNVTGVSLPSEISSEHSKTDAEDLAKNLGIEFHMLGIHPIVNSIEKTLEHQFLGLHPDVTEENIQARSRGILLMALSNKLGSILLTTGNKSELAVGYCTLYGDMAGGLAVLSDVLKTVVYDLARYINREHEIIPESTISKPPSAELRPDQKDEDSLPPYDLLDEILLKYIEEGYTRLDLIEEGYSPETVHDIAGKVDRNEYKRKQAPPGLKITPLAFGMGRRYPIAQRFTK